MASKPTPEDLLEMAGNVTLSSDGEVISGGMPPEVARILRRALEKAISNNEKHPEESLTTAQYISRVRHLLDALYLKHSFEPGMAIRQKKALDGDGTGTPRYGWPIAVVMEVIKDPQIEWGDSNSNYFGQKLDLKIAGLHNNEIATHYVESIWWEPIPEEELKGE